MLYKTQKCAAPNFSRILNVVSRTPRKKSNHLIHEHFFKIGIRSISCLNHTQIYGTEMVFIFLKILLPKFNLYATDKMLYTW